MTMPTPAFALPAVRVAVQSAMLAAGLRAWLTGLGMALDEEHADVWLIDDSWLENTDALAQAPSVLVLGSLDWLDSLPTLGCGYALLSVDAAPAEVLAALLGAAAGLAVLPPELVDTATERKEAALEDTETENTETENATPLPTDSDIALTPREKEVLALLSAGLSNKRAAKELGVSESTVKFHVQALYSKLGVQSRAAAVTRGIQLGLVSV